MNLYILIKIIQKRRQISKYPNTDREYGIDKTTKTALQALLAGKLSANGMLKNGYSEQFQTLK